ncbi:MAG: EAL domain-containing protein [Pseudomonadales bacterium]|nr:EAL domain-containing protein [Pseudomonadales bacterium]
MSKKWIVEGYLNGDDNVLQRIPLIQFPVMVGRDPKIDLPIVRSEISRHHAEFIEKDGDLYLKDLNSTNGTFINRKKLNGVKRLNHGDIIHFASYELRLLEDRVSRAVPEAEMTIMNVMPLSNKIPVGLMQLQHLLDARAIIAQFQPIVRPNGELYGYEVLGRGARPDLPVSPLDLFRIAESMPGKDVELSVLMRDCGVCQGAEQSLQHRLFVNTHPAEMEDVPSLIAGLKSLRDQFPSLPIVLEIHEDAVADIEQMKAMANDLAHLNIDLAYDDFGAGQARLIEMIDVPVKYVKFDIALIRGLPEAPESKRKMVAALAAMTKSMGIVALAEGVETAEELALCEEMGFELIQGYYFGKPANLLNYQNSERVLT